MRPIITKGELTFRSGRTLPARAQSSGSETLLRIRSLAGCTIGTLESSIRKRQVLDEQVLLKNEAFSCRRALGLEERSRRFGPLIPREERANNRFHVNNSLHPFGMALSPRKAES